MKTIPVILLTALLVIGSLSPSAYAHSGALPLDTIMLPPMYRGESAFTQIPATVGGLATTLPALAIGGTSYFVGSIIGASFNREKKIATMSAIYSGIGTIWLGSTVAGAPFYIVEKTFYDLPTAIYHNFHPKQEKNIPPAVIPDTPDISVEKPRSSTPRMIPRKPTATATIRFKGIEKVDPQAKKCTPSSPLQSGVVKSTGSQILKGASITMSHGYSPRCEKIDEEDLKE